MVAKSIIDVDVNDERFKAFSALFDKYSAQLAKQPAAWKALNKDVKGTGGGFDRIAAALLAQNELTRREAADQKRLRQETDHTARSWLGMAKSTKEVAGNIGRATLSLLKWGTITGVFSGLLGAGGLFGIDRLALAAAGGRRSSLGLGIGFGEQKAFDVNYGRIVDSGSFLSGVNEALHDASKRYTLYGAGLSESDIKGRGTAQVGQATLLALKKLADATPDALLAQVHGARGVGQFFGLEAFQRLKATSGSELSGLNGRFGPDSKSMAVSDSVLRQWQDFTTQMSRAGGQIEATFIKGLVRIEPGLEKLSVSFEKVVRAFLASDTLQVWLGKLDQGIQQFARDIGTDEFQARVKAFVDGIGKIASAIEGFVSWVGTYTPQSINLTGQQDPRRPQVSFSDIGDFFSRAASGPSANNPGNLRIPNSSVGFQQFASPEAGLRAMARQLRLYQNRDHLDTIEGIVNKYAPASENDVKSYVGDVAKRTGFGAGQHLDLNDNATLGALIAAMTKHENARNSYSPKAVVEIINNTGGNAIPIVNQVAQ